MTASVVLGGTAQWVREVAQACQGSTGVTVVGEAADLAELMAAAFLKRPAVAVADIRLPGFDAESVARITEAGTSLIGVYPDGEVDAARSLLAIGVERGVPEGAAAGAIVGLVEELSGSTIPRVAGVSDGTGSGAGHPSGRLVAVWGAKGAAGATTVAVALSGALARRSVRVLLLDAETYGADCAQLLGLGEVPSIANAAHCALRGELSSSHLAGMAQRLAPGFSVLAGLPRPALWPDLGGAALRLILGASVEAFDYVIADCSSCTEEDEELSFDRVPYRRNLVARHLLSSADSVLAVVRADPPGVKHFLFGYSALRGSLGLDPGRITVVVNRLGPKHAARRSLEIRGQLERYAQHKPVAVLPEDPAVGEAAWEGRDVIEAVPRSAFARGADDLAAAVMSLLEAAV